MKIQIELTDLFQGETNYSWVQRKEIEIKDNLTNNQIIRKAKQAFDLTGYRTYTENYGDMIKLDFTPSRLLQVMFITFDY